MTARPSLEEEPRLVLLGFVHNGCQPCRELRPRLRALAERAGDICRVEVVDADSDRGLVERFGVGEFPTLIFVKRGVEVRRLRGGALPASTRALLNGAGASA